MKKINLILDSDPGYSDAIAYLCAIASDCLDIKALVITAGSRSLDQGIYNASRLLTFYDFNIPLFKGLKRPLLNDLPYANMRGKDNSDFRELNENKFTANQAGIAELYELIMNQDEPVYYISTGPLSSLASLLIYAPEVKAKIKEIIIRGTGSYGNITPSAEFNIYVDPEAFKIVLDSGLKIKICGLDVSEDAYLNEEEIEKIASYHSNTADIIYKWLRQLLEQFREKGDKRGVLLQDPCAIMALLHPEIFEFADVHLEICLSGNLCRGATGFNIKETANVSYATKINRELYAEYILSYIQKAGN